MAADETAVGEAVQHLYRCLLIAEQLVSRPDQDAPAVVSGGQVMIYSAPSWNPGAAFAATDIHYGVRALEADVRLDVTGQVRPRGGSAGNTRYALAAIANLAEAVDRHERRDPDDKTPCQCGHCRIMRQLANWARSVEILPAVDKAARWSVIRADCADCPGKGCKACGGTGKSRVMCPYCETPSLRAAVPWGLIACGNPACRDEDKQPPVGKMQRSAVTHGKGYILWNDGRVT